jgi:hypothetical protein
VSGRGLQPGKLTLAEASALPEDAEWTGPTIRYDIVKEFFAALLAVAILTAALAVVFSSPDEPAVTIQQWSKNAPTDFVTTALSELNYTSETATYGPPYNNGTAFVQNIGGVSLQKLVGVHDPINTAYDFVLTPLTKAALSTPGLQGAISTYEGASSAQQQSWDTAYGTSLGKATVSGVAVIVPKADDGPVPTLMQSLLLFAQTGSLDADLLASTPFYGTDYTKPLMFMADGTYLAGIGDADNLSGDQWGMMNETGNYPGQAWLWLYTMFYQIPPYKTSTNADALVWVTMMGLTLLLLLVPFIPGLRSTPRLLGIYRIVWRDHYRQLAAEQGGSAAAPPPTERTAAPTAAPPPTEWTSPPADVPGAGPEDAGPR